MQDVPFVSVIIPIFGDSSCLREGLIALSRQTYARERFEVIVVDNGSPEAPALTHEFGFTCVPCDRIGVAAARNAGVTHAKGEIIAFTDADCVPAEDWIARGVSRFLATPDCGIVGGAIVFTFEHDPPNIVELYDSVMHLRQRHCVEELHYALTANVFTSRKVLDAVGAFRMALKSGEDFDLGQRVHAAGMVILYDESVRISHPARSSLRDLYQKSRRFTGGVYDLSHLSSESFLSLGMKHTRSVLRVWVHSLRRRDITVVQKCGFIAIFCFICCVEIMELLRLRLGGRSAR